MEPQKITLSGSLQAIDIDTVFSSLDKGAIYLLDFDNVKEIGFAAVRTLIQKKEAGFKFQIIHAEESVASFFDRTGASSFISVCRKAIPFDISGLPVQGESYTAKTYFPSDDTMAKVYADFVPEGTATNDLLISRLAMLAGIETPMVSDLIKVGEKQYGILFERVLHKRSFARAISQEPERIDEFARRFTKMAKQLHATPCNTAVFPDHGARIKDAVEHSFQYTESERNKLLKIVASVPPAQTCIHGDLHIGNIITNEKSDLFIDLGDFSYGNPLWDIAMLYFLCHLNPIDAMIEDMFHVGIPVMRHFWQLFANYYFGADTEAKQQEVHNKMRPLGAVQMVYLVYHYHSDQPFMTPTVRRILAEIN